MSKIKAITPLILAGGKSTRMGQNKAFVLIHGKPMIEVVLKKVSGMFECLPILITNTPEVYAYLGVKMIEDIIKNKGPLAGIHAGLSFSRNQFSFIFGCDMPFLNADLIRYMTEVESKYDVIIPKAGHYAEPLHAVYSKDCLAPIEASLVRNERKIISFFADVKVRYIERKEIERFPEGLMSFQNINTQDDLKRAQARKKGKKER